jgi:hypothetical protein
MALHRRLIVLAAAAAGAGVLAQPSLAARPSLPFSLDSAGGHFQVHYQSDVNPAKNPLTAGWAITETQAGDIAALAERAYAKELADGYAAPPNDGDGRIDLYVTDEEDAGSTGPCSNPILGLATPDTFGVPVSSGYVELNGCVPQGMNQHTIAHELFHLIQFGIWIPTPVSDYWLLEASAEWMGFRADGYGIGNGLALGPSDMALDCRDPIFTNKCDLSGAYKNDGYSRWAFFEYVTERFGASFVKDVFAQGAAGAGTATQALAGALAARGTTLADVYDDWTSVDMRSAYSAGLLQGLPPTPYTTVQTGQKAGTVASLAVPVNHLSTRYVEFARGGGTATAPRACFAATLSISVTLPAGTSSKPVFWWAAPDSAPVPLAVSGSTASATLPWDTCTWLTAAGFLALPNASTSVDAADFQVTATMTVDTTKAATATAPPPEATLYTPVVPVTSAETAPVLAAFGPEVLRVGTTERYVRLIVQSNAEGAVRATLGSVDLGAVALRPGNNDVRFRLPKGIQLRLRRVAGTAKLVLTPMSPQGHVLGAPVLRTIAFMAPAKTKAHRKHK